MSQSDLIRRWWQTFWDRNYHTPDKFLSYAYKSYEETQKEFEETSQGLLKLKLQVMDKYIPVAEERMLEVEALRKLPRRIFLTGDIHGSIDISTLNTKNFPQQKELSKHDILICLGDFGLIWDVNESKKEEQHWVDWLDSRNFTTIVVLGNHENYDRIEQLPEVTPHQNT